MDLSYRDLVELDPIRMWNLLRSKCLQFIDRVMRGIIEKVTDDMESFVVGDVGSWFLPQRLPINVLRDMCSVLR